MRIEAYNFNRSNYVELKASDCYLRWFELDCILRVHNNRRFNNVLELGCGQGTQAKCLSKYAGKLVCTDINKELLPKNLYDNIEFLVADAQDLSQFKDGSFDLIFSLNLLEHLPKVDKCIAECKRILKDDGIMIHSVPNNTWKVFFILLYYPVMAKNLINRIIRHKAFWLKDGPAPNNGQRTLDDNMRSIGGNRLLQKIIPKPHGFSTSHMMEYKLWKEGTWIKTFEKSNLRITRIIRLPFYYGHGLAFIGIHRLGNKMKLSSSTAYELSKA